MRSLSGEADWLPPAERASETMGKKGSVNADVSPFAAPGSVTSVDSGSAAPRQGHLSRRSATRAAPAVAIARRSYRQAQTATLRLSSDASLEPAQQTRILAFGDPDTVIDHAQLRSIAVGAVKPDETPFAAVIKRVLDEIAECEPRRVGVDGELAFEALGRDLDLHALGLGDRGVVPLPILEDRAQGCDAMRRHPYSALLPRKIQQLPHQPAGSVDRP